MLCREALSPCPGPGITRTSMRIMRWHRRVLTTMGGCHWHTTHMLDGPKQLVVSEDGAPLTPRGSVQRLCVDIRCGDLQAGVGRGH